MNPSLAPNLPDAEVRHLDADFPVRVVPLAGGVRMAVRESGQGAAVVCLHGIGSGAASWLGVARRLDGQARLIAWDAPGYGDSTALSQPAPRADDYAGRLEALLDALDIERCLLVGHSLGAIVAAAAARHGGVLARRIERLLLISPARGYGSRTAEGERVRAQRLEALAAHGIEGMAAQRSQRLVSEHADALARAWVHWNMARLNDAGYRQAIELLCGSDLLACLPPAMPVRILCGAQDVVTTPEACREVAAACEVPLELLAHAGHACYVEQPQAVGDVLRAELGAMQHPNSRRSNP